MDDTSKSVIKIEIAAMQKLKEALEGARFLKAELKRVKKTIHDHCLECAGENYKMVGGGALSPEQCVSICCEEGKCKLWELRRG